MSLIHISNLTFSYEGGARNIFEKVSLQLDSDWKLGFIGRNGKGKTTFLKLLAGGFGLEYSGSVAASVEFHYFPFPVTDPGRPALCIARSAYSGIEDWALERELALLDADAGILARPFCSLSSGERTKIMLAALFLKPNAFLLVDEPTNHLDAHGRDKVSAWLRKKRGFILVSHDRAFLDACVDHVLSINRADIEVQQGNYSSWKQNRDYQDSFELARQDKLKKDVQRLSEAARRTERWSDKTERTKFKPADGKVSRFQQAFLDRGAIGHKAAKMMKRSKSLEKRRQDALEEKSALLRNLESVESLKICPLKHHARVLAEAVDLSLWHDPEKALFRGLSFRLEQGQRLAVTGKNGSGKSSLLTMLAGLPMPHVGRLRLAGGMVVSRVTQELGWMQGSMAAFCRDNKLDETLFRAILSRLDLPSKEYWHEDLRSLSGGQRKKTALARSLSERAHLYIWDEALNFMDVPAREQVEELLTAYSPSMVFVEHDRTFVERVATDRLAL